MDSNRAARLAACLLIGGLLSPPALAAAEEPQGEIVLPQALALALERNPELAAFSQEIRAAEAAVIQADVLPNPKLDVIGDNLGNTRKKDEGDRSASLLIGQLVELGGKRAARMRIAETGRDLAGWDYEAKRAEIFARVRQTFVEVLTAQGRTGLADESVRLAQSFADAVAKRVQAGKVSPVEETKARLTVSAALIEREQARRELAAARTRLAALWANPAPRFGRAAGDLERVPPLPAFETLAARIRDNPELARWATEIQRRQAGVEAERAKAVPDITVSGGISRFSVYNDNAYLVGISIPIPVFDQNRGGILEANRRLDKAADEQRAVESRLTTELSERDADDVCHPLPPFQEEIIVIERLPPQWQRVLCAQPSPLIITDFELRTQARYVVSRTACSDDGVLVPADIRFVGDLVWMARGLLHSGCAHHHKRSLLFLDDAGRPPSYQKPQVGTGRAIVGAWRGYHVRSVCDDSVDRRNDVSIADNRLAEDRR
jgi:cobalt-zinc-cadmium efflux system outer membrane protein